jgi:hypothetical protein
LTIIEGAVHVFDRPEACKNSCHRYSPLKTIDNL